MSTEREIHARFVSIRDKEVYSRYSSISISTRPATTPSYKLYVMVRVDMRLKKYSRFSLEGEGVTYLRNLHSSVQNDASAAGHNQSLGVLDRNCIAYPVIASAHRGRNSPSAQSFRSLRRRLVTGNLLQD